MCGDCPSEQTDELVLEHKDDSDSILDVSFHDEPVSGSRLTLR